MTARKPPMTAEERAEKIASAKIPGYVREHIASLEDLTRTLAAQLGQAQAQDSTDLTLAREISAARDQLAARNTELTAQLAEANRQLYEVTYKLAEETGITWQPPPGYVPEVPAPGGNPVPGLPVPAAGYATARVYALGNLDTPIADLPEGARVRFAGWVQVSYGPHEDSAGARALNVQADGPLVIRPASRYAVIIAKG